MSSNPFDRNKTKEAKLGELITEPGEQNQRDAVHIAVVPVIASGDFSPGEHVGVTADGLYATTEYPHIGIVDPFLSKNVEVVRKGQTFWLFLYQGQVTTLRHEWTHPAFPAVLRAPDETVTRAKAVLQEMADGCDMSYEALLQAAKNYLADGTQTESWDDNISGKEKAFWGAYEIVVGQQVRDHDANFFSCCC